MKRQAMTCTRCGATACSIVPPVLDGASHFAMRKMLGALGMASVQVENFLDAESLALAFDVYCQVCTGIATAAAAVTLDMGLPR